LPRKSKEFHTANHEPRTKNEEQHFPFSVSAFVVLTFSSTDNWLLMTLITRKLLRSSLLTLVLAVVILSYPAYLNSFGLLCVDSGRSKAQVIIMLGGGLPEREIRAAELYRGGAAPLVIITGAGDHPELLLQKYGVPAPAIRVESAARSTWQNATFTVPLLRQLKVTNAILVTSWFHSRRALACFRRAAPGIQFHSCPTFWGSPSEQWQRAGLRRYIAVEYLKSFWYTLRYQIPIFCGD
jgi:uncharacterized SAM-binding protein YcdF (DUF218 family)